MVRSSPFLSAHPTVIKLCHIPAGATTHKYSMRHLGQHASVKLLVLELKEWHDALHCDFNSRKNVNCIVFAEAACRTFDRSWSLGQLQATGMVEPTSRTSGALDKLFITKIILHYITYSGAKGRVRASNYSFAGVRGAYCRGL